METIGFRLVLESGSLGFGRLGGCGIGCFSLGFGFLYPQLLWRRNCSSLRRELGNQ